ncbi:TPA: hypothetical protein ACMDQV_002973 [Vibrio cholerae]
MKADYNAHQKQYLRELRSNPSLTQKQYCDKYGLTYATAKRYLKKRRYTAVRNNSSVRTKTKAAMTDKKRFWLEHVKAFTLALSFNPRLSSNRYAVMNGINSNTFRKYLGEFKSHSEVLLFRHVKLPDTVRENALEVAAISHQISSLAHELMLVSNR